MNSQENIIDNNENDSLSNISITDVEAQITDNLVSQNQEAKTETLKGILRRETPEAIENDDAVIIVLKTCSTIIILIIMVPIIVSDLYFGFTDTSCVKNEPDGLDISMKLYLLVSGFVGLAVMVAFIFGICSFLERDESSHVVSICCVSFTSIIAFIFNIIWNILGAIVFWGTIYGEKICNKNVSTYIFVSLILKLIGSFIGLYNGLNSDKKK
jgi:hypothetical protein